MGTEIWCLALVNAALCGVVIHQQRFYTKQIHLLVDKLMSRSYAEYQRAATTTPKPEIKAVPDVPDDLRVLQEFHIAGILWSPDCCRPPLRPDRL